MWHALDIYWRLLSVQLRSQLQYRVSFLLDLVATLLTGATEFASIALVFERFGHIRGWTLGEVAFLYGQVEFSFGLMDMVFSGFDPPNFGRSVRRGTFDQLLLRPVSLTFQVLGSDFALRRLGRITRGAAIFAFALARLDVQWTALRLAFLPVVAGGMVCFFGGLFIAGATITFWTIESIEIVNVLTYGGSYAISFPMHIYQNWLRRFFTYIVPAIFLNYYPTLFLLDKPDPFNFPPFAPFVAPVVGVTVLLLALAFWRYGITHYQSTGT